MDLGLVLPDFGSALVLLGVDGGDAGIVVDVGVVIARQILGGSDSSTRMDFYWGNILDPSIPGGWKTLW